MAPPAADVEDGGGVPKFEQAEIDEIRTNLLAWYDGNHRILPWRRNPHSAVPDAHVGSAPLDLPTQQFIYWVWVCEIMAQQTQLDRVKQYWKAWMQKWPTVADLAVANEDDVRAAWAGLGYYRRAAFLLKGARYVATLPGGAFPTDEAGLRDIPGVGPYTAAAVSSIACGARAAVVDGNVIRVLARLRALGGDPKATASAKLHASLATQLLDPDRPGDFNQAVMELGAMVCVPSGAPACGACPVAAQCAALSAQKAHTATGGTPGAGPKVTDYPAKTEKAAKREETVDVCVVEVVNGGGEGAAPEATPADASAATPTPGAASAPRLLLTKRPEGGLLAGLWEFPTVPVPAGAGPAERRAAVDAHVRRLLGRPLPGSPGAPAGRVLRRASVGEVVHVFSHIRMTLIVEHLRLELPDMATADAPGSPDRGLPPTKWVASSGMAHEQVSSSVAKCWRLVASGGGSKASAAKRAAPPASGVGGGIKKFFQPKGAGGGGGAP